MFLKQNSSHLTIRSPAKINWLLHILDKRQDGYHNIISLMHCINLFDTIRFEPSNTTEIISNMNIAQKDNLVMKAMVALLNYIKEDKSVKIILNKEIPIGAGLGGGSSNAAYTLIGLNILWDLHLTNQQLMEIGGAIGSDVPFFFNCPISIVQGRGELIKPLTIAEHYHLLLVKPDISIPTKWAYNEFSKSRTNSSPNKLTKEKNNLDNIKFFFDALNTRDYPLLRDLAYNDFEFTINNHYPIIKEFKKKLIKKGAIMAQISGSGSVVFGLYKNKEESQKASESFSDIWHRIVYTLTS